MTKNTPPVRIGLLGCGTVGGGVIRLIEASSEFLGSRIGAPIEIVRVLVRDPERERVPECRKEWLTTDPESVLGDPSIELIVEVMGGEDPARDYIERALAAKKSVVTANKLLIAKHGPALLSKAAKQGVDLAFEASVGGGIPVIRTLREALTSDWVVSVHAILNGTCNYILTRMRDEGLSFEQALAEAQRLGYAEADPALDVDGHDAAQKLVVISMLAFGAEVDEATVPVSGIRGIDQVDFRFAERFGLTLKHLAIGHDLGDRICLRVHPALVPQGSVLANIDGVLNGVYIMGRALGPCLLVGRGAGDMPTAVSVVADVVDVARSRREGQPGMITRSIDPRKRKVESLESLESRYYLRFQVGDQSGVLGNLTSTLGAHGVSIEQVVQDGRAAQGAGVPVLMITHKTREGGLREAVEVIKQQPYIKAEPRWIRIEDI